MWNNLGVLTQVLPEFLSLSSKWPKNFLRII